MAMNQLKGEYQCLNKKLIKFYTLAKGLLDNFPDHELMHIRRSHNVEANELAQMAYGYRIIKVLAKLISSEIKVLC